MDKWICGGVLAALGLYAAHGVAADAQSFKASNKIKVQVQVDPFEGATTYRVSDYVPRLDPVPPKSLGTNELKKLYAKRETGKPLIFTIP